MGTAWMELVVSEDMRFFKRNKSGEISAAFEFKNPQTNNK
jgi:hypothetical protein